MESDYGPWRDGRFFVYQVDRDLPNQCVLTNNLVADGRRSLDLYFVPFHHLVTLLLLPFGVLLYFSRRQTLDLYVDQDALDKYRRLQRRGWRITITSLLVACVMTVVYVFAQFGVASQVVPQFVPPIVLLVIVGSVIRIFYGLFYRGYRVFSSLHIHRIQNGFVWLANVNNEFLATLPNWDPHYLQIKTRETVSPFAVYSAFCPQCGVGHRDSKQMDCPKCDWLRVPPTDRKMWDTVGQCPNCSFSYRWDGTVCSHCGYGDGTRS